MYKWLYWHVVRRYKWLTITCTILIEILMILMLLLETAWLFVYHYGWNHWSLKRKAGHCWICDSYLDHKNTDQWLADNYRRV